MKSLDNWALSIIATVLNAVGGTALRSGQEHLLMFHSSNYFLGRIAFPLSNPQKMSLSTSVKSVGLRYIVLTLIGPM